MEGICTRAQSASSSSESLSNAGHILRPKASSSGSSNGNGTPRAGSTTRNPVLHAPSLRATHHGSSSASHHSSTHHSNGCVRWCINVALQSFGGEPWAVALRPAEEAESELSFLTGSANEAARLPQVRPQTTSNSASSSLSSFGDPTAETIFHNNAVSRHAPHSTAATRCGLQLSLQEDLDGFVDGPAHEAAAHSEELQALVSCLHDINDPPMRYGTDELLLRFTHVEFEPEYPPAGVPPTEGIRYRLNSCVDGMLNATLQPAVSAVVDHCVNAMVLVYGATQEMKQMGLIGTPTECGLLPHGIRLMLDKLTEREERQRTSQTSGGGGTAPNSPRSRAAHHDAHGTEAPPTANGTTVEPTMPGSARGSESFILPHIGTTKHRFVRVEATFIAFDSTSVVDLLDLSNQHVELVLQLAPPPSPTTMSGEDRQSDDGSSSGNTAPSGANKTTDAFVVNARAMNADTVNSALSALDVGLENLSRAMEQSLLQSESSSSLLFSLTAYTDTCRCATMHLFCLAEDPAAQIWLASTVQARSQAIPLGEEQSWASIQNTPMPPPLHHHAATMLVPALCFGNVFTSVLLCVYNSTAAIGRLNRDLKIAVSGYRMRTIPLVTHASTRRSTEKLPAGWEEHFTQDGRRYFIDSSTYTTTWSDPRIHPVHYTKPKCFCGHTCGCGTECVCRGGSKCPAGVASQQRPYRIPMQPDDKDFLGNTLRECCHASAPNPQPGAVVNGSAEQAPPPLVDVGIVVVDPTCKPRIVLHAQHKDFAWQVRVEQEHWKEEEAKLLDSKQAVEETAAAAAVDAGAHHDGLEGGGSSIAQARHCSGDEDMDQAQEANPAMDEDALISLIKTGKFFSAAMAEQVAASGTEPCGTSASSSSATPQCGPPSLSASAVDGGTTVAISPDMQDMESLVDEFTLFFRKAYRTEQRVKELEAEVAMLRSHAPRPDRVGECGGGDGDVVEPTPPWAASLASELTSVRSAKLQTQLRSALERASRSSTKLGAQPADTSICQSLWQEVIRELDDPSA